MKNETKKIQNAFRLQTLTEEEKKERGILNRIAGPCANIIIPTRNGRLYSESLWKRVFSNDELVSEMFENGGLPMELDHPIDREETCSERIAAMMPERPKEDEDGHLLCYVDIVDTPLGRIANQLVKYGFNIGISSRGSGDIIEGVNGEDEVDPETYEFKTFDLVLLPAVKEARLTRMTESLEGKTLKESLKDEVEKSTEDEKKIMTEMLSKLNININSEKREDIKKAGDDGLASVVKELQESLKTNKALEKQIAELQEKLSVCYAKETNRSEIVEMNNQNAKSLSESKKQNERLSETANNLTNDLLKAKTDLDEALRERDEARAKLESMRKANQILISKNNESKKRIDESIESGNKVKDLEKRVEDLNESIRIKNRITSEEMKMLKEDLKKAKAETISMKESYEKQITEARESSAKYKKIARTAIDKYIDNRANMLGVNSSDIKERLSKGYSFSDIDRVCENLCTYSIQMNKLPFKSNGDVKMRVSSSGDCLLMNRRNDDDVDSSLLELANSF